VTIIYLKSTRGVGRMQVVSEEIAAKLEKTKRWERYATSSPAAVESKPAEREVSKPPAKKHDQDGGSPPIRSIEQ